MGSLVTTVGVIVVKSSSTSIFSNPSIAFCLCKVGGCAICSALESSMKVRRWPPEPLDESFVGDLVVAGESREQSYCMLNVRPLSGTKIAVFGEEVPDNDPDLNARGDGVNRANCNSELTRLWLLFWNVVINRGRLSVAARIGVDGIAATNGSLGESMGIIKPASIAEVGEISIGDVGDGRGEIGSTGDILAVNLKQNFCSLLPFDEFAQRFKISDVIRCSDRTL